MSENARVVALLLLLLVALGVVGKMDYEDARRSEQLLPNADLYLQRNAAAVIPLNRGSQPTDDAANKACLDETTNTDEISATCNGSRLGR